MDRPRCGAVCEPLATPAHYREKIHQPSQRASSARQAGTV
jgi:hypothetical protein